MLDLLVRRSAWNDSVASSSRCCGQPLSHPPGYRREYALNSVPFKQRDHLPFVAFPLSMNFVNRLLRLMLKDDVIGSDRKEKVSGTTCQDSCDMLCPRIKICLLRFRLVLLTRLKCRPINDSSTPAAPSPCYSIFTYCIIVCYGMLSL